MLIALATQLIFVSFIFAFAEGNFVRIMQSHRLKNPPSAIMHITWSLVATFIVNAVVFFLLQSVQNPSQNVTMFSMSLIFITLVNIIIPFFIPSIIKKYTVSTDESEHLSRNMIVFNISWITTMVTSLTVPVFMVLSRKK